MLAARMNKEDELAAALQKRGDEVHQLQSNLKTLQVWTSLLFFMVCRYC